MPTTARHLYKRLTHKYRDGYSDLDRHDYKGTVRFTSAKVTRAPNDMDDGGEFVSFARIPAGLGRRQRDDLVRATVDTLSQSPCRHEHDCCGCRSVHVDVTLKGRVMRVAGQVSYNY